MADTRTPRGLIDFSVLIDLSALIAATALSSNLPLYTRNPEDFSHLSDLIDIVPI